MFLSHVSALVDKKDLYYWLIKGWRKLSVDEHGSFGLELALKFYMFVRLPKISSNLVGANITQDHLKSSSIVA